MFFYLVKISSKDINILKDFLIFLKKKAVRLNFAVKPFSKKKQKKFVTVLKSPHVNKSAQEQFEFRIFSKILLVKTTKPFTFLTFLKKLNKFVFPGIDVKVSLMISNSPENSSYCLDPDTLNLNFFTKFSNNLDKNVIKLTRNYFHMFDIYGESFLKR